MMMQLESFGKWNKEDVRQLEVIDLVCLVYEIVKRAGYKMSRVLKYYMEAMGK